jgi:ribonuclease T2
MIRFSFFRAMTAPAAALAFAALSTLFGAGAGFAQESGCILDNCADKRPPVQSSPGAQTPEGQREPQQTARPYGRDRWNDSRDRANDSYGSDRPRPRGASQPGDFDFYVLSLSWSSGFCATGGADKGKAQCDPGAGLGFVVHGLWPQYERGFPQDCGPAGRSPSRIALDQASGLFPDMGLARYEWRKHGTCSGKSPSDYFADVRRARDSIIVPPQFKTARGDQTWTPVDILRAFESANPRLRPGMSAVGCRAGVLQEVRFCFSKDLREFRACPEVARQTCRTREITAPAPL